MLHLAALNPIGRIFLFPSTLFAVGSLVAGVAHAFTTHAQSVSTTLGINTLGGRNVALSALPAAVALTAPPGVLTITAAQDGAGSWGRGKKTGFTIHFITTTLASQKTSLFVYIEALVPFMTSLP